MKHLNLSFLSVQVIVLLLSSPVWCFQTNSPSALQATLHRLPNRYSCIPRLQLTNNEKLSHDVDPNGVKISTSLQENITTKAGKPSVPPPPPPPPIPSSHPETKKELTGIDIERADLRLQGLELYALIGALQSSASISLLTESGGIDVLGSGGDVPLELIEFGLLVTTLAAAMGGLYVTMVFSLCSLYGKSAIGMYRDVEYDSFMETTGGVRYRVFQAFTYSLVLFGIELVLLSASKLPPGLPRILAIVLLTSIVFLGWREMQFIVEAATSIYTSKEDDDDLDGVSEQG